MLYVKHSNGFAAAQSAKADMTNALALAQKYAALGQHSWIYDSHIREVVWDSDYPNGEVFIDLTYGSSHSEKHYRFVTKGEKSASELAMAHLKELASRSVAAGIPCCGSVRSCKGTFSYAIQDGSAILAKGDSSWSLI